MSRGNWLPTVAASSRGILPRSLSSWCVSNIRALDRSWSCSSKLLTTSSMEPELSSAIPL